MVCGKAALANAERATGTTGALASGTGSGDGATGRIAGAADGGGDLANGTTGSLTDSDVAVREAVTRALEENHFTSTRTDRARNGESREDRPPSRDPYTRAEGSRRGGSRRSGSRGDFDNRFDDHVASGFGRFQVHVIPGKPVAAKPVRLTPFPNLAPAMPCSG